MKRIDVKPPVSFKVIDNIVSDLALTRPELIKEDSTIILMGPKKIIAELKNDLSSLIASPEKISNIELDYRQYRGIYNSRNYCLIGTDECKEIDIVLEE